MSHRLHVPDVSCGHCVTAISTSVGRVPGVTGIEVDLGSKTVTVAGDAPFAAVCDAINDAGYDIAC